MGKKKHRQFATKSIEQRWEERKVVPKASRKEILTWLAVLIVSVLLLGFFGYKAATTPKGRSVYGGNDVDMIDARVESIAFSGDGSETGNYIREGTAWVYFGKEHGGLLLESEWAERFEVGESYNLWVTKKPGQQLDRIVTYDWRGGKT